MLTVSANYGAIVKDIVKSDSPVYYEYWCNYYSHGKNK